MFIRLPYLLITKVNIINKSLIITRKREESKQRAPVAIDTLIPLAMIATLYTGRPALQDRHKQERITIVASSYPLYEYAFKVDGDRGEVSSLVPASVESHDWEPCSRRCFKTTSSRYVDHQWRRFERWASDLETKFVVNTSEGIAFNHEGDEIEVETSDEHGDMKATTQEKEVTELILTFGQTLGLEISFI